MKVIEVIMWLEWAYKAMMNQHPQREAIKFIKQTSLIPVTGTATMGYTYNAQPTIRDELAHM